MPQYISKTAYQTLQKRLATGAADISVPRKIARQSFGRVSNTAVFPITGQPIALKKTSLFLLFGISIGLFVICLGLIYTSFNWRVALAVPAVGIFWAILIVLSSDKGNQCLGHFGLLASLVLLLILSESYSYPAALVGVSIWLHRCLYFLSQFWFETLLKIHTTHLI